MTVEPRVFVVDDDPAMRDSLKVLLETSGYTVPVYESAIAFFGSGAPAQHGCVLADVRMPEMDGLELQQRLKERGSTLPVILMTGHADVPLAVRAMKEGAIDFLEKPFKDAVLVESVRRALEQAERAGHSEASAKLVRERLADLTDRERQVLELLVAGRPNKIIAYELSISPRTVEIHRARVMDKMGARSLAELVRMTLSAVPA
ncbi:MAG: response regulator [Alphaproteobacteria bacterium]|nr:response regulator [Alphaproteobacteria bacterium]MBV9061919.1 response regulator [Alphaproteobacteria bacterium]